MSELTNLIIIALAIYAFTVSIQMLRGKYLDIKPLNCKFCLGAWSSLLFFTFTQQHSFINVIVYTFATTCISYFLGKIDDKFSVTNFEGELPPIKMEE